MSIFDLVLCIAVLAPGVASADLGSLVPEPTPTESALAPPAPSPPLWPGDKTVRFGARVGVGSAKLAGDAVNDAFVTGRTGFWFGAFATFKLHPYFALEPGLGYVQKGLEIKGGMGAGYKLDYVHVPVMAVMLVPVHRIVRLRGLAGPAINYNVSAKETGYGQSRDLGDVIRSLDVGVAVGVGIDLATKPGLVLFDLRYEHGLRSIDGSMAGADVKNRHFLATAGFGF